MFNHDQYIFVLWGEYFQELTATLFITLLREAGKTAKVVSTTGRRTKGAHGLAIVSDMTLEQALPLAVNTSCIVIPGGFSTLQRLRCDPRIQLLFERAQTNGAKFVIEGTGFPYLTTLFPMIESEDVMLYSAGDNLATFVSDLIHLLSRF